MGKEIFEHNNRYYSHLQTQSNLLPFCREVYKKTTICEKNFLNYRKFFLKLYFLKCWLHKSKSTSTKELLYSQPVALKPWSRVMIRHRNCFQVIVLLFKTLSGLEEFWKPPRKRGGRNKKTSRNTSRVPYF